MQIDSKVGATTTLTIVTFISVLLQLCLETSHYKQAMLSRHFKRFHDMCYKRQLRRHLHRHATFFLIHFIMERSANENITPHISG